MDDNEWETVQPSTSASQSDQSDSDADAVVLTRPTNFNNPPILAPTTDQLPQDDHHLQEPPSSPPSSHSSSITPYTTEILDGELPQPPDAANTRINASLGILSSWVLRIAHGIRSGIGFWSIASVGAFVAVVAYARRWQRRRSNNYDTDKLLNLLKQKDEKIKQLLLQIDRMNEKLLARRRVPVLRVVVDSPLVIGSRLN